MEYLARRDLWHHLHEGSESEQSNFRWYKRCVQVKKLFVLYMPSSSVEAMNVKEMLWLMTMPVSHACKIYFDLCAANITNPLAWVTESS